MIPNQWYVILESNEVKTGKPVGVTRMGEKLVLWRDAQGQVTCMADLCPHRGVALSIGKLAGECVECPFHGFQFDPSGRCTLIPANGKNATPPKAFQVKRVYPAREAHGFIYIYWGEPKDDLPPAILPLALLPPLPWFDSIDDSFSYSTLRDLWATHYSRAIENQLDSVHVPFVHKTTIGRGNRTLINGPLTHVESQPYGDVINMWVFNEVDTGQKPRRASELPAPTRHPMLQFIFPNLWQNWIADDLRVVVAFVPIDAENTMMYLRQYQRIARTPVVRELFNALGTLGNLIIERQDKRIVITQRPKASGLHIGEKMIPGDGPIVDYRRRRDELIAGK
jgi:phenylpropionate dioxygenase-like ring-hydroxylating dioxygenase large terminal subunit